MWRFLDAVNKRSFLRADAGALLGLLAFAFFPSKVRFGWVLVGLGLIDWGCTIARGIAWHHCHVGDLQPWESMSESESFFPRVVPVDADLSPTHAISHLTF